MSPMCVLCIGDIFLSLHHESHKSLFSLPFVPHGNHRPAVLHPLLYAVVCADGVADLHDGQRGVVVCALWGGKDDPIRRPDDPRRRGGEEAEKGPKEREENR